MDTQEALEIINNYIKEERKEVDQKRAVNYVENMFKQNELEQEQGKPADGGVFCTKCKQLAFFVDRKDGVKVIDSDSRIVTQFPKSVKLNGVTLALTCKCGESIKVLI